MRAVGSLALPSQPRKLQPTATDTHPVVMLLAKRDVGDGQRKRGDGERLCHELRPDVDDVLRGCQEEQRRAERGEVATLHGRSDGQFRLVAAATNHSRIKRPRACHSLAIAGPGRGSNVAAASEGKAGVARMRSVGGGAQRIEL